MRSISPGLDSANSRLRNFLGYREYPKYLMIGRYWAIKQALLEEYEVYKKLTPPRIMTSEGEVLSWEYDIGSMPKGALAGIPVSSGTIEGRSYFKVREIWLP